MSNKKSSGSESRRNSKKMAVEILGGSCSVCGYNKCQAALDFHHKDPEQKEFQISKYRKRVTLLEELKKCEILCKNCHTEKHEKDKSTNISKKGKVIKPCKVHGETFFYVFQRENKSNKYACATCMIERQKAARIKLKTELVSVMGGSCQLCGYRSFLSALEFHHVSGKDRQVSTIKNRMMALEEIKKCILLCKNCHMEKHWGLPKCT